MRLKPLLAVESKPLIDPANLQQGSLWVLLYSLMVIESIIASQKPGMEKEHQVYVRIGKRKKGL